MRLLYLSFILGLFSCTSLQPLEIAPENLQAMIARGEILHIDDKVKIITSDGKHHQFKVTELNQTVVKGRDTSILIKDIVAVETREFSTGKTTALAGSAILLYGLLATIATIAVFP